jgi:hypothetical protein
MPPKPPRSTPAEVCDEVVVDPLELLLSREPHPKMEWPWYPLELLDRQAGLAPSVAAAFGCAQSCRGIIE